MDYLGFNQKAIVVTNIAQQIFQDGGYLQWTFYLGSSHTGFCYGYDPFEDSRAYCNDVVLIRHSHLAS